MQPVFVALIPAYQPTFQLIQIAAEIKNKGFQLIIVDDGSKAETKPIFLGASSYGVVLHHPQNMGKGRALKTGLAYIQTHYPDSIVVTLDADGQHSVDDAEKLCRTALTTSNALVLGSRKLTENVPLKSLLGNSLTRFVYYISTGKKLYDTQTGLRAFSAYLIPQLLVISGERYEYEMNVLLTFSRIGIPIQEEEIATIYINGNASSHFDAVRDSYRIYKELLKFSASSLISFAVDYVFFSILILLTNGMGLEWSTAVSNICARLISASVNYTLNRKMVFQSSVKLSHSIVQYLVLAAVILIGNTAVLTFLSGKLGMNQYIAKLITEMIFFFVSWVIQRKIIFRYKNSFRKEKK